jgi:NADPH2:quinone reductase
MRAVVCHQYCDYRDLKVEADWPAPVAEPGQVLIDVHATGVGFANILQIAGTHQNKAPVPFIPGTEASGIVRAVGEGVTHVVPGDRVIGAAQGGGFAQQSVVRGDLTFRMPDAMSFEQATLFPTIYGTAYLSLVFEARLHVVKL